MVALQVQFSLCLDMVLEIATSNGPPWNSKLKICKNSGTSILFCANPGHKQDISIISGTVPAKPGHLAWQLCCPCMSVPDSCQEPCLTFVFGVEEEKHAIIL